MIEPWMVVVWVLSGLIPVILLLRGVHRITLKDVIMGLLCSLLGPGTLFICLILWADGVVLWRK